MTHHEISPADAARALADVADRRRQVAAAAGPFPGWYSPAWGALAAANFALRDMPHSPFYWPGFALIVVVGGGLIWLAKRQQRVRPHPSLYGVRAWAVLAVGAVALLALALAADPLLRGMSRPHTVSGVVFGVLLAGLGELHRRWLRRELVRRAGSR